MPIKTIDNTENLVEMEFIRDSINDLGSNPTAQKIHTLRLLYSILELSADEHKEVEYWVQTTIHESLFVFFK